MAKILRLVLLFVSLSLLCWVATAVCRWSTWHFVEPFLSSFWSLVLWLFGVPLLGLVVSIVMWIFNVANFQDRAQRLFNHKFFAPSLVVVSLLSVLALIWLSAQVPIVALARSV